MLGRWNSDLHAHGRHVHSRLSILHGQKRQPTRRARSLRADQSRQDDSRLRTKICCHHIRRPDDLPDGGAGHFAATIKAIKQYDPDVIAEVLIPDFQGKIDQVRMVVDAGPEVVAHNIETTEPLTPKVRDSRATYRQSLNVLKAIKELNPAIRSKSSIMLGLGEVESDLVRTMRDLRDMNVDILTLGQYLRPTKGHIPVSEYVSPDVFEHYKQVAEQLGFLYVAAGPFVRSSYRAGEYFLEALIRQNERSSS